MSTATEPGTRTATTYIVLQKFKPETSGPIDVTGSEIGWQLVGQNVTAPNAEAAIREIAEQHQDGGVYVAVPTRSWKPVTARAETRTVITLDET